MVVSKVAEPQLKGVRESWGKLHSEYLQDMCFLPNIVRVIVSRRTRRTGSVARLDEKKHAYRTLVGKPDGNRRLERPRCGDDIKTDLK